MTARARVTAVGMTNLGETTPIPESAFNNQPSYRHGAADAVGSALKVDRSEISRPAECEFGI